MINGQYLQVNNNDSLSVVEFPYFFESIQLVDHHSDLTILRSQRKQGTIRLLSENINNYFTRCA